MTSSEREEEQKRPLAELITDMVAAQAEYQARKEAESLASSATCAALNALNHAQVAVEKALAQLRGEAPNESDWGRGARRPYQAL